MSRILVVTVLLAGLTAVASSQPARPTVGKAEGAKKAGDKDALPTARSVVAALLAPVTFRLDKDPKTTLEEVLDELAKRHGISYTINQRAFRHEGLMDVAKAAVAETALPSARTTLGRALARVLDRVPSPSGATFLVREDGIEITTRHYVAAEVAIDRRQSPRAAPAAGELPGGGGLKLPGKAGPVAPGGLPGAPMNPLGGGLGVGGVGGIVDLEAEKRIMVAVVSVAVERQPLEDALRQVRLQANVNLVLDPGLGEKARTAVTITLLNAPVDSAVRVLTEMVELDHVWLDNIFYVTTRDRAEKLRASWPGRRSGGTATVAEAAAGGM